MPVHDHREHQKHKRRGKDPVGAANIKLTQIDSPSSSVFTQQNARDQITGNDKEDPNSRISESAPDFGKMMRPCRMPHHDRRNRYGAQSVQ
jgi:hypothetical protein